MDTNSPGDNEQTQIALPVTRTPARNRSPFAGLPVPQNHEPLSQAMNDTWVIPYYWIDWLSLSPDFVAVCQRATPEIALTLLGEFDWRSRTVAAGIVAIRRWEDLQAPISNLFLRSDICYAGKAYCFALASFQNEAAVETLCIYLDYYLRQPDLWFDQNQAMSALLYLDREMGSNRAEAYKDLWQEFVANKPNWDLERTNTRFQKSMDVLQMIAHNG